MALLIDSIALLCFVGMIWYGHHIGKSENQKNNFKP
jgi:hypothetical protein